MKRRNFIKRLGLSGSAYWLGPKALDGNPSVIPAHTYPKVKRLSDAVSQEGELIVRVEFRSALERKLRDLKGKLRVDGGQVLRMKSYFFEAGEDNFVPETASFNSQVSGQQTDVLVVWMDQADEDTQISLDLDELAFSFQLKDLLDQPEISHVVDEVKVTANLLLDKEIGTINLSEVGGNDSLGSDFSFAIMADPQGGDPEEEGNWPTRMKIHNAWIEDSIRRTNELDPQPAFTLVLGDIVDSQGQMANFVQMNDYLKRLNSPVLYAIGNHETRYRSEFTPGYNMEAFANYFAAQKALNGMELMLYSFDLGAWHFVVWPDPLRNNFWETHPHYFDWLERDLEKNREKPTFFFQHVPSHPIGINPLINYAESVAVKRTLLDILAQHGNVKYVFSGHVHIPVKASFKTAVTYRGMKMINLPAAGYRPRGFGEEDFAGGPCQGVAVVDVNGKNADVRFRTVTQEEFQYPETLPVFEEEKYALWLNYKWQLPASEQLIDGNFEQGLKGWTKRFVYTEDENPSNICEVRPVYDRPGFHALYLYNRKRGYDIPGQDRLPQTINRIAQAVQWQTGDQPLLKLKYQVDGKNTDLDGWCGAYVQVEAFSKSFRKMSLVYWTGMAYTGLGSREEKELADNIHLKLTDEPNVWHKAELNLASDFSNNSQKNFDTLNADRLVVTLGVWTINDGGAYPYGIYFDDLELSSSPSIQMVSRSGNKKVDPKPNEETWWLNKYTPFTHVAGEHRYIFATKPMGPGQGKSES
jgi:3',5'-cyclic AMP phosphodiesterase CpdA